MSPKSAILLPLYIYPLPGAWEPLYQAISAHPDVNFIVIVNPHNGPGSSLLPDASYTRELPKLNARPNVSTIGYIRIDYCKRDLSEVDRDISTYAGWSKDSSISGCSVDGIFVDEAPNIYSEDVAMYLNYVTQRVKATNGIMGTRLCIHNPGTCPDPELTVPGPDITAVVEESFEHYQALALQERLSMLLRYDRSRCAFIVHSVPEDAVKPLVQELRKRGMYLFVTNLHTNYYVQFGSCWGDFVKAMDS
ncbi:Spherulation-specific family 4 [Tricladium varicosporioides]|nr:Spherulation-specific family 4 [Hymenoscyphus varicosporioides]